MGYLTDIADTVGKYLASTQPDYNRRRDAFDKADLDKTRAQMILGELRARDPNNGLYGRENLNLALALDSIPVSGKAPESAAPAPQIPVIPSDAPAPAPTTATPLQIPLAQGVPGVALRNRPWTEQNMGVIQDAERLKNEFAGGVAESQSRSSSGASPEQADQANKLWLDNVSRLTGADRDLALKKAELAIMKDQAGRFLQTARSPESANAYLKEMDDLQRSIDSSSTQDSRELIEVMKSAQRTSTSNKQSETQMARIEAARQIKQDARATMSAYQAGQLRQKDAELMLQYADKNIKNELARNDQLAKILANPSINPIIANQLTQLYASFGQQQKKLNYVLGQQSPLTAGVLSKDDRVVQRAVKDFTDSQQAMAEGIETAIGMLPVDPETGAIPLAQGGVDPITQFKFRRMDPGGDPTAKDWNVGGGLGSGMSFISSGGISVPDTVGTKENPIRKEPGVAKPTSGQWYISPATNKLTQMP